MVPVVVVQPVVEYEDDPLPASIPTVKSPSITATLAGAAIMLAG